MSPSRRDAAAVGPGHAWIVRAWKWGAGSLSAGAALVSIISSVRSITVAQQVRWVGVAPAADTAWALGDTLQLAITLTDAHGGVVPGVSVGWTSTDSSVASVDSGGSVVARSGGATTIIAAAGGHIAQSRILVRPRPAAIRIFGDTLLRVPEGSETRLVARVVDARRHPVPGQPILWRSADPSVVSVDSADRASAASSGHTTLVASSGDLTAELPLEVYPVPATITLLAGDAQHAPAARRLPGVVKAQVVSRGGRPMSGVAVRFAFVDGAGRLDRDTDTSNADGIVQAVWTLGGRPGRQRLSLGVDGTPAIATAVVADADPVPENTRIIAVDGAPAGRVGEMLPEPVRVRVSDSTGAPLPDIPVAWETAGGLLAGDAARTDSLGEARARWTLGARAGTQEAYVQVGASRAVPRFAIRATALSGPAAALALVRSVPLRGSVGQPVASVVAIRVSDRGGNPIPGAPVTVRLATGSARPSAPVTDSTGRVAIVWTLGSSAGAQRLSASVPGVEHALEIRADARPGRAEHVALDGLPASAPAGRPLAQPVTVVVTDTFDNPVPNALVVLTSRSGRPTPARLRTDSTGRAAVRWLLGRAAGDQQLEATVQGSGKRATGKILAVAARTTKR
jgi:hypothetical protein